MQKRGKECKKESIRIGQGESPQIPAIKGELAYRQEPGVSFGLPSERKIRGIKGSATAELSGQLPVSRKSQKGSSSTRDS